MKSTWTVEGDGYHCLHLEWCKMDVEQQLILRQEFVELKPTECGYGTPMKLVPWGPIYFAGLQALSNGCLHDIHFFLSSHYKQSGQSAWTTVFSFVHMNWVEYK